MKNSILYLLVGLAFLTSCEWVDPDINKDPDAPENPSLYLILPSIQGYTAYNTQTFDVAGTTGMWTQQIAGAARQAATIYNYTFKEGDVANAWSSFYADAMYDANIVIKEADKIGRTHYKGVAQIMMAYNLGLATQLWGDIPYSACFQGEGNLNPTYDSQQAIYTTIFALLDSAITYLNGEDNGFGTYTLEDGDLIYGGNTDAWVTAAHVLKARYFLHISKRDANAYQDALDELDIAQFASSEDNFSFPTGDDYGALAPLVEYDYERADWEDSDFFQDLIANNHGGDPRIDYLNIGGYVWGINYMGNVPLITYVEQEFIKAEAYYRVDDEDNAKASLVNAVSASMDEFYASDSVDWLTAFDADVAALSGTALYEEIMTQKYIALFLQPEAFADWRRSGIPELTPVAGTEVPRRFPYSSEERSYNQNIPSLVSIFERNWIDVE